MHLSYVCLFQVSNVWATKFGLLLERKNTGNDAQLSPPGYMLKLHKKLHVCLDFPDTCVTQVIIKAQNLIKCINNKATKTNTNLCTACGKLQ